MAGRHGHRENSEERAHMGLEHGRREQSGKEYTWDLGLAAVLP